MADVRQLINNAGELGEREALEAFLDDQRDAVVRKASGVSEDDARRRLGPSATSLGGVVKHLRWVELGWFQGGVGQRDDAELPTPPWTDDDPDADFRLEPDETLAGLIEGYLHQCRQSRETAARYPIDHTFSDGHSNRKTLRWVYLHMIEETARHAGHVDILREQIDGTVGD